ncbi:MAG: DUF4386 family protein [Terriglobales bacterium]
MNDGGAEESDWKSLYIIGGATVLIVFLIPLAEVGISYLPGVEQATQGLITVVDWFRLFQAHWFLGLRNLGFLNLIGGVLLAPTVLAVYSLIRRDSEAYAAFGLILFFVGLAVYLADSRALAMLSLSGQYARATSDAQRSLLMAAGQTMVVEGESRTGLPVVEFACLIISVVMLKGKVFSKATAYAGILGNGLLLVVEVILSARRLTGAGMAIAAGGGIAMMTWYFLVGRKLLQLGRH